MVEEESLCGVARKFFAKIDELRLLKSGCFLLDTLRDFTFIVRDVESELAKGGKNREGLGWLRQSGMALLVDRQPRLPFFYREYETGMAPRCFVQSSMTSSSPCRHADKKKWSSF